MDFNEAMREQEAKDREAALRANSTAARTASQTDDAVTELRQALQDFVRYLEQKGAPRYQYIHEHMKKGRFSRPQRTQSPIGYVLRSEKQRLRDGTLLLCRLELLCADGRVWSYYWRYDGILSREPEFEWRKPGDERFNEFAFNLGDRSAALRGGKLVAVGTDVPEIPLMQHMAELASKYVSAWGNLEAPGLTRVR